MSAFNNPMEAKKKYEEDMKKGGLLCKCAECGNIFRQKPIGFFYVQCPVCGEDSDGMVSFI